MEDELRLLRQAHDQQAKRVLVERVVAADRIRVLELRVEQCEREAAAARREAAVAHEDARRHVEAARRERDSAARQLEDFQRTRTYRLVMLVRRLLSRGPGPQR
jgi:hypothetical protein